MYKKRFLFFVLALSAFGVFAQDNYYVSKQGSDLNTGSVSSPFETISKALNSFGASGGNCFIMEGTYHENIIFNGKNNITIQPYNNDIVILDGTVVISTNWTQSSENTSIYETILSQDIWQLFIDDKQQVMARWPNAQFIDESIYNLDFWAESDVSLDSNGTMNDVSFPENLASSGINAQGALAIANVGSWKTWVVPITSHTTGSNIFNYVPAPTYLDKHHYYYLEGKIDLLDTQNEWHYNATTKKLSVWGDPTGKEIRGKVQSYVLTMNNCSNIVIENLNFFATTISATGSNNITVNNCLFSFPSCSKRMLGVTSYPLTTELSNGQAHGHENQPGRFKFFQCLFEHTDGEAIFLHGQDNIIEDCYFHHIDYSCGSLRYLQNSIINKGPNCTFKNNTVHTTSASSVLSLGDAPKISYNDISKTGMLQDDGALVQLPGKTSVPGSEIHHNWLHDSVKTGVRYDAPVSNPELAGTDGLVHHNVFWNLPKAMMIKGDSHEIYNNTSFDIAGVDYTILDESYPNPPGGSSNTSTILRNNLAGKISGHRQNPQIPPGTEDHNVYSATNYSYNSRALLADPENKIFTPKSSAIELIDAGVIIPGITDNYLGIAPEIGAYELGDNWTAGASWTPNFYPWSFSYDQNISGFVVNPSFEDGSIGTIIKNQTLNDWKLGGPYSDGEGVSASIQTANVHPGDGTKALEVSSVNINNQEWGIRLINTEYAFVGDNTNPIDITVSFWAKTSDIDPGSEVADGDMRLLIKDTGSLDYANEQQTDKGFVDKTQRVLLTTDTWVYITKIFTFPAAADYNLSLFLEFGKVDGITQIDGITTSVTGGATLATQDIAEVGSSVLIYPNPAMDVLNYISEGVKYIEVYNSLGQKLKGEKADGSINTSAFPKGSYILKLLGENGAVSTKKFKKE